jgi:tetratricopeptide (TPR) repeat protein
MSKLKTTLFILLFVGACLNINNVLAQTQPKIDSVEQLLTTHIDDTVRVDALTSLAKLYRNTESFKALQLVNEAYNLAIKTNYKQGVAMALDVRGVVYLSLGDQKKALNDHLVALNLCEQIGYKKGIATIYNNIGSAYINLKNYPRAEYYYIKSLKLKVELGMGKELSSAYVNLGTIKMHERKLDECIKYYELGLNNAIKYNDLQNIAIGNMNLGEAYYDIGKYDEAIRYYNKAAPFIKDLKNNYFEGHTQFAIGKICIRTKDFAKAEKYINHAIGIAKKYGFKTLELNGYQYLSILYEDWNKPDLAIRNYKQYIILNDTIYNSEMLKSLGEMQTRYEIENKNKQIELLNKDKLIADATLSKTKIVRNFSILGFLLFLIVAAILTRNIVHKQHVNKVLTEKNRQIQLQQIEIERQNQQLVSFNKELLKENISAKYEILKAKINPHFLFNSLSSLSNLIINNRESALDFVSKFSKLYRRILEIDHIHLITIKSELEFVNEYLYIQKIRFKEGLSCVVDITEDVQQKYIPPFCIQLMVENAIKHNIVSIEQKLHIRIFSENGFIIVANNLQKKDIIDNSLQIGQQSVIDRYKLITPTVPVFKEENNQYLVYLPIIEEQVA